ncbi:hypothetical protein J6590_102464 [Homalodisca vitripennis]|nr:hypothetical protein J6590_102464 [Homalodisca vitripennis]
MRRFPQQYLRRHSLSQDPCHDTHYTASLTALYNLLAFLLEGSIPVGSGRSRRFRSQWAPIQKKGLAQPFMRVLMALAEGFMAVPYVNSQAATAAAARRPAP